MTKEELGQLYHLKREIKNERERLAELRAQAEKVTQTLSAQPGGGSTGDRMAEYAAAIADLTRQIEANERRCLGEVLRLEKYIAGIPDSQMRQIMRMRYIDHKTWQQIAFAIGEWDEQNPRKKHAKFLSEY